MPTKSIPNLLTDATPEEMNADFEIMQRNRWRYFSSSLMHSSTIASVRLNRWLKRP